MRSMREVILIKYGELWLKSESVRRRFVEKLAKNIRDMLKAKGVKFTLSPSRDMTVLVTKDSEAIEVLERVFGISWFARAKETDASEKSIEKASLELAKGIKPNETFAVRASRSDKSFALTSKEIEERVGAEIDRKVNLSNPDFTIFIEVKKGKAYVYTKKIKGLGGMPYGVSGRVLSLISGGIDSPVASWLLMKRGCSLDFVHFHPEFFASEKNKETVLEIIRKLREYSPTVLTLYIVPFGKIQEEIIRKCERRMTCVLCRRAMYRAAELLAKKTGAKAVVTGENLAQVASQTLDNLFVESEVLRIPIFRPLIGMDKEETIALAKKIGTYELLIQSHGCCTITPKKPATKAKLEDVLEEEGKIRNLQRLIETAIKRTEKVVV